MSENEKIKRLTIQYKVGVDDLPAASNKLLIIAREQTQILLNYLSKVDLAHTKSSTDFVADIGAKAYGRLEVISDAILDCQTLMRGYHDLMFGKTPESESGPEPSIDDLNEKISEIRATLNKELEHD